MNDYREDLLSQKRCAQRLIKMYAKGHYCHKTTTTAEAKVRVQTARLKLAVIEEALK